MIGEDEDSLRDEEKPAIELDLGWGADYRHAHEKVKINDEVKEQTRKRIFQSERANDDEELKDERETVEEAWLKLGCPIDERYSSNNKKFKRLATLQEEYAPTLVEIREEKSPPTGQSSVPFSCLSPAKPDRKIPDNLTEHELEQMLEHQEKFKDLSYENLEILYYQWQQKQIEKEQEEKDLAWEMGKFQDRAHGNYKESELFISQANLAPDATKYGQRPKHNDFMKNLRTLEIPKSKIKKQFKQLSKMNQAPWQ